MFACAFCLGPLIFLLIILIDLRVDGQRLLWLYRRPIGFRAQDIGNRLEIWNLRDKTTVFIRKNLKNKKGSWNYICRLINIVAIVVNGLIISFTSNWSKTFLKDDTLNRLIFFVVFEVFFLLICILSIWIYLIFVL